MNTKEYGLTLGVVDLLLPVICLAGRRFESKIAVLRLYTQFKPEITAICSVSECLHVHSILCVLEMGISHTENAGRDFR
jgi:hypothetical protein